MIRPTETGQLVNADDTPVSAGDGVPLRGEHSGIVITDKEESPMAAKADKDGIYVSGKTHIYVRKGDVIPAGAEPVEQRAKQAAPENKSRKAAPETKDK